MNIKTIIFDFGNVIGFFDHRRITRRLAKETGLAEELWQRLLFDPALEDDYDSGRISSAEFLRRVRQGVPLDVPEALLTEAFCDIFWPNAEVCGLVPQLASRYRLLVGSNTCELHAQKFRELFAATLHHVHAQVLSFEVGARKPKRAFFEHCRRLAECEPGECVFIDDLHRNVEGARACGLHGIVYRGFDALLVELKELGVTPVPLEA
jgi:putative hydrolase of the HAD superfamily